MLRAADAGGWRAHLSPFDWGALLSVAAVVEAVILLVLGLALIDVETIAFGLVVAATTAILFVRRNRLALLVRFAVFADVDFWMATAAASNMTHGAGAVAVIPPLALAVTSSIGLVATIVSLSRIRRGGTRVPRALAMAAAVAFLLGASIAIVGRTSVRNSAADISISIKNAHYSATTLRGRAHGGHLTLKVSNRDVFWHTFTSSELGIDERFPVKAERTITITARPGVYGFYCAIPGHVQIGMKGTITVT